MKTLLQPRAVTFAPTPEGREGLRRALAAVGVEAYAADSLEAVGQRARREDTIMLALDATGLAPAEVAALVRAVRAEPKSHDVVIALFSPDADEAAWLEAGANMVERRDASFATALRMLVRLGKRPRPEGLAAPADGACDPLEVLKAAVAKRRARHKLYLGASPGVGKTYAMLREAHERAGRGEDVVVGIVETHGRAETAAQIGELSVLPRRAIAYRGATLEEMDLEALLERRPAVALVDELAHTNVPGSVNAKRYEDVNVLLLAGIPVISTVNIQHLESLNHIVERLTGVKVRETIPDAVLDEADEVVLVDISAEALQQRLQSGKIYALEKVSQSLANFFTTHNLTALRELVLRELADKVDSTLEDVRATIGKASEVTGILDRLVACITPTMQAQRIIRRAARLADRLNGRLTVLHVEARSLTPDERKALDANVALAESFEAEVVQLRHPEPAEAIARFATNHQATILLLGESRQSRWRNLVQKPIADVLLERTANIDLVIVATHA